MAAKNGAVGFTAHEPRLQAPPRRVSLVAGFRAKLANKKSPLDNVAPEELEQARKELRELPEVIGEPLPAPRRRKQAHLTGPSNHSGEVWGYATRSGTSYGPSASGNTVC
jgi:hypothetical protein